MYDEISSTTDIGSIYSDSGGDVLLPVPDSAGFAASESASGAAQGALQFSFGSMNPTQSFATTTCSHTRPVKSDGATPTQDVQSFAFGSTTCVTVYPAQFGTTSSTTIFNTVTAGDFLLTFIGIIGIFIVAFLLLLTLTVGVRTREHIREL